MKTIETIKKALAEQKKAKIAEFAEAEVEFKSFPNKETYKIMKDIKLELQSIENDINKIVWIEFNNELSCDLADMFRRIDLKVSLI